MKTSTFFGHHDTPDCLKYVRKAERMGKTVVWLTDAAFWDGLLWSGYTDSYDAPKKQH